MTTPANRFKGWVDSLAETWKDQLRGWMGSWLGFGIEVFFDILGKSAAPKLKPLIDKLEATGEIPPELKPFLDEMKEPTGQAGAMFAQSAGSALIGGAIGKIVDAILLPMAYAINSVTRNVILSPDQLLWLWRKGYIEKKKVDKYLSWLGYNDDDIKHWEELTIYYPGPAEVMAWAAREVFEPKLREKFQLDKFRPPEFEEWAAKVGITDEVMKNFWASHWKLPSITEVIELWRRKIWDKETVDDFWTELDMVPWVREDLFKLFKAWPTRVDVRRWWDMRTIDEARLRELYQGMGYWDTELEDYVLWTKVYTAFPDLIARWTKGWITENDVKTELIALGMPKDRATEMIQTKIKAEKPGRTTKERDITKTDIIKGVKQGVISRTEGVELLIDMGYDEDEAVYILEINIPPDEEDKIVRQRELSKTDIIKGLKTAVITEAEALTRLLELRYSRVDAVFLIDIFKAMISPPAEPREREASKADIILAVKKGLISPEEAYLMLQDIGFTPEASIFILEVRAESSPFSPINFTEFKELTQKYRVAIGREVTPMPEEIKKASEEVVRLTGEVEALEKSIEDEKRGLVEGEILPESTTKKLKKLEVAKNRAIAELARVKSEYQRLVAEWRHELP